MVCPYLKRTVMPICRAKKGAFMAPNIHELQYYCMSVSHFHEESIEEESEKG
jgi:hypothetical protein